MKKSTAAKIFGGLAAALGTGLAIGGICKLLKKDTDEIEEGLDDEAYEETEENTDDSEDEEDE